LGHTPRNNSLSQLFNVVVAKRRLVRKTVLLPWALFLAFASLGALNAHAQSSSAPAAVQQTPAAGAASAPASEVAAQPAAPPRITAYALPPDRDKKARALSKVRLRLYIVNLVYGLVVLLLLLRWRLAPKYRDAAEKVSSRRFLQVLVFSPLLVLTIDALSLPTGVYDNWIQRAYGLSVQGWGSWFWDWSKGELVSVIVSTLFIWILYGVIRKSPRRWWFYFWLSSLPIILALFFLQPLVIDPMFHKFEPLQQKNPALTAELEKMVQRAGQNIPRERIFWMGAAEKTTELNAYVSGFGASERIVVWDTTIARMTTPQIVFVAGHEMGHYVLHHIVKGLCFLAALLFITFYLGCRLIGWVLASWGQHWEIRGLDDWASFPALLLLVSLIATVIGPIGSTFSRYQEHQADQYGLEVTHGLTPDSGQVAAQAFNILGDVDLSDPNPNAIRVFLLYDHPAIPDRIRFCLSYDPWSRGEQPEFVK
jgi:Zn-dependent protease with chaperone function